MDVRYGRQMWAARKYGQVMMFCRYGTSNSFEVYDMLTGVARRVICYIMPVPGGCVLKAWIGYFREPPQVILTDWKDAELLRWKAKQVDSSIQVMVAPWFA
uniref:Uncharacterized protein n=1 Tax=Chromera velia CCMP2878 TaxID=1169474 RepID=A0A0G4GM87_9ALVE|eukprot:Cvel_22528.t1-p1 / transcript=Cvel_22528.t1 / gene=Cvel_22528 / organism=Chromera_velia_CCMP2878 / gene_product=hypothetical protein / transcript_product=hypothetical protein / location=Cvel_scaffold2223:19884-20183(+) / protein_length=100 / sequence_SO=supercontig / SO=protein_coding / is_pseudo=false